jgi:hypothetical protein
VFSQQGRQLNIADKHKNTKSRVYLVCGFFIAIPAIFITWDHAAMMRIPTRQTVWRDSYDFFIPVLLCEDY